MQLHERKHWIFDMDGTLTNAIHDFDAIRATLGLPVGKPILEALAELPEDEAAQLHKQLDAMEYEIAEQATAQPGASNLLEHLKSTGTHLGILTRNGKGIAHATLDACGLRHFFADEYVVSRDCCTPKPDSAGVELLLQRWNATPESSVMVGDFLFDLQAGRNAEVATVHLDVSGEFSWPDLTDVEVLNLNELLNRVKH